METEESVTVPAASVKWYIGKYLYYSVFLHGSTFKQIALTLGVPLLYWNKIHNLPKNVTNIKVLRHITSIARVLLLVVFKSDPFKRFLELIIFPPQSWYISDCRYVSDCRNLSDCRSRACKFDPGPVPYFCGDWSWNNFYGHSPPFRCFKKGCCQLQVKVCTRSTG